MRACCLDESTGLPTIVAHREPRLPKPNRNQSGRRPGSTGGNPGRIGSETNPPAAQVKPKIYAPRRRSDPEMESTASVTRMLDSHLELMRFTSAAAAILFGIDLALFTSMAVLDFRRGSPRVASEVVGAAGFSLMLIGFLSMRTSRYQRAFVRRWHEWHRKSRAERLRAIGSRIVGAVALVILGIGVPILIESAMGPGQGWFEYFVRAAPATFLVAAAVFAGAAVWHSGVLRSTIGGL